MAITNAQQAKQLLEYGGRVGLQGGGADMGTVSTPDRAANKELSDRAAKAQKDTDRLNQQIELRNEVRRQEAEKQEELVERFRNKRFRGSNFPGLIGMGLNLSGPLVQKGMTINRNFFLDKVLPSKNFKDIDFTTLTPSQQDALFSDYMSERLSGNIDAYGNQLMTGDSNDAYPIPRSGIMAEAPSDMDQEPEIEEDEGLFRRFRADGGGMRPNPHTDSGFSKATKMTKSVPSGGGGPPTNVGGGYQKPPVVVNPLKKLQTHFANNQKLKDAVALGLITNEEYNTLGGYDVKKTLGMGPIDTGLSSLAYNVVQSALGPKFNPNPQPFSEIFGDVARNVKGATNISPDLQTKYENIMQMADGGRAGLAEGGMPYEGGIMDLESARQMYGLGKLVKKVTRAVKKVVKSPIGKAALLAVGVPYALGAGPFAAGSTMFGGKLAGLKGAGFAKGIGSFFGKGSFNPLLRETIGGDIAQSAFGELVSKIGPTGIITGASAIAGALTPEEEQEAQTLVDNTGIDIEEARNSILAARREQYAMDARARGFKADGGLMRMGYQEGSKEPVAKKTMPLLDMGGMEKDYREDGGFVPIGRMERADDVPARLSKNEFVFTADAVRNAGDGDIDKGAEVMYNMMKNLEAGGEVSEESQGLEGARRMFQTSQRLEEVI